MRVCHACQRELEKASLDTGRCVPCGAVVRTLAQRTFEDKRGPRNPPAREDTDNPSKTLDHMATDPSIELPPLSDDRPAPTLEIGDSDTAGDMTAAQPSEPRVEKQAEQKSGPGRKSPTLGDQSDLTIEFPPPGAPPTALPPRTPGGRTTHTIEGDRTIDLDVSSVDAKKIESHGRGTFDKGSRQGQTIRQ